MSYLCHCVGIMEFVLVERVSHEKTALILCLDTFFFEAGNTIENWLLHQVQGNGVLIL